MTGTGEAYFDIVWRQFRKNRIAYCLVWVILALFGVAIFAPVLASNQPYWFTDPEGLRFPWLVSLVNAETAIDFVFNLALLVFIPWATGAWLMNREALKGGVPGRRRVGLAVVLFFFLLALAILLVLSASSETPPWIRWPLRIAALGIAAAGLAWRNHRARRNATPDGQRLLQIGLPAALFLAVAIPLMAFGAPDNRYFARDFKKDRLQGKGSGVFTLLAYGPMEHDLDIIFKKPLFKKPPEQSVRFRDTQIHLLGTDDSGRDVLVRIIYGTRISMTIGVVAVSIYITIGIIIGAVAGYFGGRVDMVISRVIEIVLLFPSFFLILTLVALIGPSIYIIMVVIGLTGWPTIARLTRGEFLKQRSIDYVAAARGLGASNLRVIFRHILPNALSPAFVAVPFGIVGAIITEASLSVLGFGVRPPAPSWGSILLIATSNYEKWWLTVFAGLSIFLTVTVFNVVGSGLRDAMDPRLKGTQ